MLIISISRNTKENGQTAKSASDYSNDGSVHDNTKIKGDLFKNIFAFYAGWLYKAGQRVS